MRADEHLMKVLRENFEAIENIVENSFSFKMNFTLRHNPSCDLEYQFELL